MIKIAFKHIIYEVCIYVFFKGIYNNFILSRIIKVCARTIRANWSIELKQDLMIFHGKEIDSLMEKALEYELCAEIDEDIKAMVIKESV